MHYVFNNQKQKQYCYLFFFSACVDFVKGFDIPLLILGGGGYTVRNVARCWANETSILVGSPLDEDATLPLSSVYTDFFRGDFKVHTKLVPKYENQNSKRFLTELLAQILHQLSQLEAAPSVPMDEVLNSFAHTLVLYLRCISFL
eukprot:m.47146 g.47146  ORF g.47146 m.47146 type:complete len:145 (+) comp10744_c0_seq10:604-1038(+)